MRIILFDIDGTLLLTGGAGSAALARVFESLHGVRVDISQITVHGQTDPSIIQAIAQRWLGRILSEDEFAELADRYLPLLEESLATSERFRVLPGARTILEGLRGAEDAVLGLATGNIEPAAFAKLRRAQLDHFFEFGGFGSDSIHRPVLTQRAVERGRAIAGTACEVIVVGDTIHDVESARKAGAQCLAVATGNASMETLREAGADWVVPSLEAPQVQDILRLPLPSR